MKRFLPIITAFLLLACIAPAAYADSLDIRPDRLPDGTQGIYYTERLFAVGGVGPFTFSANGFPDGLSIDSTGLVSGRPSTIVDLTGTGFTATILDQGTGESFSKQIGINITPSRDIFPPSLTVSVAQYSPSETNVYTITAHSSDNSDLTDISIYLAQGTISAHGAYTLVKSCTGEPCAYTSGDNSGSYIYYATATDASPNHNVATTDPQTFTLPFGGSALSITTTGLPDYNMGCTYQAFISATGGTGSYSWSNSGLPSFLTGGTGTSATITIVSSGVVQPTAGTSQIDFTVTSGGASESKMLALTVTPLATISTTSLPSGTVNSPYTAQASVSNGVGIPEWYADNLPTGLSIGRTTGVISGTPTQSGTFSVVLREYDGCVDLNRTLSLSISPSGEDTAPPDVSVLVTPYSSIISNVYVATATASDASGISDISIYVAQGTISAHGAYTKVQSCSSSPCVYRAADSSGPYVYHATASDASPNRNTATTEEKTFTLPFGSQAIDIQPTILPGGTVGVPYSQPLQATGGVAPYIFSADSRIPAGLSISSSGVVSGTPTQAVDLTISGFAVNVVDHAGNRFSKGIGIRINDSAAIDIQPTILPGGTVGVPYSQPLQATGGVAPYAFSAEGLPAGLSISTSGTVSGIPTTAIDLTNAGFTVHVTDSAGSSLFKGIGIRINPAPDSAAPTVSTSVAPYGNNGGNVYTITVSAADASGISDIKIYVAQGASANSHGPYSAVKSCSSSPCAYTTASSSGSYVFYATATDASPGRNNATSDVKAFLLPFDPQSLVITTGSLPDGTAGQLYNFTLQASGGTPPYSWSLVQGDAIFTGLGVNSQGQVSGTPVNSGIGLVTVRATDSAGRSADKSLSLQISSDGAPAFQITTQSLPNGAVGQQYGATISVNGNAVPSSWGIPSGALPPGLSLNGSASSATILGTPNATGTYSFKVRVNEDGTGRVAEKIYIVTISSAQQQGGNAGGSGSAGGSVGGLYRTSTKVAIACAGKESKISVKYLIPTAPSATIEIAYVEGNSNAKVFSRSVSSTTELSFVADKPGAYELRVSIDTTQSTSNFLVPACGLSTSNAGGNSITVDLSPAREAVSSRTVDYGAGFSKTFRVFRITNGGVASYSTEITLVYSNPGAARQNVSIADSVPKEVLSNVAQIIFQNYPAASQSQPSPRFSWSARSVAAGGNATYSYRIDRPLTNQMIDKFEPPRILAPGETIKAPASGSGSEQGNLLAASIGFAGFSVPFSTLAVAAGGFVLLALILLFVFGRKKDEE